MAELQVNRQYKDRVFRMIFNSREKLLELYNAMNGTDYENVEELEIVTLENAVYLAMKNDLAYVFHDELFLYEQQSVRIKICLYAVFFMSVTVIPEWSEMRIFTGAGRSRSRHRPLLFFIMEKTRWKKEKFSFLRLIQERHRNRTWNFG